MAHQRIYDNHVSLAKVGINVRGRSRKLTVNYRTTKEILALTVPTPVTGLDGEPDSLTGYHSPLHGRRPEVQVTDARSQAPCPLPFAACNDVVRSVMI